MAKVKKQNLLVKFLIFFIILVSILLVVLFLLPKKTTPPPSSQDAAVDTLNKLEQSLNINSPIQANNYFDWISNQGKKIPLAGSSFEIKNYEYNQVDSSYLKKFIAKIEPIFITSGFIKNVQNQMDNIKIGYEKGDIKCIVYLTEHTVRFGTIFCGSEDFQQIALQESFRSLLDPKNDPKAFFRVEKMVGNYARGVSSYSIGPGHTWLAIKKNDQWKIVITREEPPLCSEVDKFQLPKEIYENCYLNSNTLRFPTNQ